MRLSQRLHHRHAVVYAAEFQGLDLVKIGFSTNLNQRLIALGSEASATASLVIAYPGDLILETALHYRYQRYLVRGREWFTRAILDDVRGLSPIDRVIARATYLAAAPVFFEEGGPSSSTPASGRWREPGIPKLPRSL